VKNVKKGANKVFGKDLRTRADMDANEGAKRVFVLGVETGVCELIGMMV